MKEVNLIEINESILAENRASAAEIEAVLKENNVRLVNVMGSPGAGKTSFIASTIMTLSKRYTTAVIEADLDSKVDAEFFSQMGIDSIQIKTGGFCHVNPAMVKKALSTLELKKYDIVFLENVGNLICPAEVELGATLTITILSVPEGDDKAHKYPLIFAKTDVLIISKSDYLKSEDYDIQKVSTRVQLLNDSCRIFTLSSKYQDGIKEWTDYFCSSLNLSAEESLYQKEK